MRDSESDLGANTPDDLMSRLGESEWHKVSVELGWSNTFDALVRDGWTCYQEIGRKEVCSAAVVIYCRDEASGISAMLPGTGGVVM